MTAFARYDWNEVRKCWEWTVHMYERRICCSVDELVARLTAHALNELRFSASEAKP